MFSLLCPLFGGKIRGFGYSSTRDLGDCVGHGAVQYWAAERLLKLADIDRLTNNRNLALMLPWTCYDGLFDYPGYPSFGESIVRAEGRGAKASWPPSGLGLPAGH